MTNKEVANKILEKYRTSLLFKSNVVSGRPNVKIIQSTLKFDLVEDKPNDRDEEVLNYWHRKRDDIIDIIDNVLGNTNKIEVSKWVDEFLSKYHLTHATNVYLVAYLAPVED